ncbi:hypothetical protein BH23GEM7_BH23GEM7_27150 [soil metagenome]
MKQKISTALYVAAGAAAVVGAWLAHPAFGWLVLSFALLCCAGALRIRSRGVKPQEIETPTTRPRWTATHPHPHLN